MGREHAKKKQKIQPYLIFFLAFLFTYLSICEEAFQAFFLTS